MTRPQHNGASASAGGISADEIDSAFVPLRRQSVVSVELEGEAVLFESGTESVHRLDKVGSVVWACLDGSGTIEELARDLGELFSGDRSQIVSDIVALVRQLGREGLLEGVKSESTDGRDPE